MTAGPGLILVYNFLPGVSIGEVYEQVLPKEKLRLARDMGRVVRELHDLPLPAEGPLRRDWAPFREFMGEQHAARAARLAEWKALPPHLLSQVERFLPPLAELIDESVPPRFLHGDLTRDHLLGQVREGRWITSGWIDFGDARAGDPMYEWVALHLDLFGGDRALFKNLFRCLRAAGSPARRLYSSSPGLHAVVPLQRDGDAHGKASRTGWLCHAGRIGRRNLGYIEKT